MAELTQERLAELRRIAEAATPGPWELDIREYGFRIRMGSAVPYTGVYKPQHLIEWDPGVYYAPDYPETDAENRQYLEAEANARHIAEFDPPTALAMVAEIEWLRRVVEQVEWRGYDPSENGDVCPWCSWEKRDGHAPDCELAAALADAPDKPENPLAAYTDGQLYDELRRRGWVAATWAREEASP